MVVVGVLHSSRRELQITKNFGDTIQAHYLAVAGIEKAKALLYEEMRQRRGSAKSNSNTLYNNPSQFRDILLGRGHFRVIHQTSVSQGGETIFGVSDEESRLNLNVASAEELMHLPGMQPEIAAAIQDWRDEDDTVTQNGAEAEYYLSRMPRGLPRNGPFQTPRELLMVRGVASHLFFGGDVNQDGFIDDADEELLESRSSKEGARSHEEGWEAVLTVDSTVDNVNAAGEERINIQTADENALAALKGFSSDLARAMTSFRKQKKFESIVDLLDVTAPAQGSQTQQPQQNADVPSDGQNPPPPVPAQSQSQANNAPQGEKLINEDLLMNVADDVTIENGKELQGLVNINTAGEKVLSCLSGITPELASAIVSHRKSNGDFSNIAGLLKVPGMNSQTLKTLAPRITARSETFRIISEGKIDSSGARKRIQEIVHLGASGMVTVSYREDM